MRGPPKRNGPVRTAILNPSHDRSFVSTGDRERTYSEPAENARPSCAECAMLHPYENGGGECRALPPRFLQDGLPEGAWPIVSAWDWCGAFARRGKA